MREGSSVGLLYFFKTLQLSSCAFNAAKMFLLELKGWGRAAAWASFTVSKLYCSVFVPLMPPRCFNWSSKDEGGQLRGSLLLFQNSTAQYL